MTRTAFNVGVGSPAGVVWIVLRCAPARQHLVPLAQAGACSLSRLGAPTQLRVQLRSRTERHLGRCLGLARRRTTIYRETVLANQEIETDDDRRPVLVDLFSGAGGLSEGLRQAGFRPVFGVDFDKHAVATYAKNHTGVEVRNQDISEITASDITSAAGTDDIALIAGGPSCQGFSTHGKRVEDDPRNFLFKEFVRLVDEVRPRFFLMENVKGMLSYRGGRFRAAIEDAFRRIGYEVTSTTLLAADYGVPQLRHRVFFLGTRTNTGLSFPATTHAPGPELLDLQRYVTVQEAIGDLPLMNGTFNRDEWEYASEPQTDFQRYARAGRNVPSVTLHQANGMSDHARRIAKFVEQGEGLRSIPDEEMPARFKKMRTISNGDLRKDCTTLYYRLHPDEPAYTITCYYRNIASGPFLNPWEDRSLSHREAARFMSFPDHYEFVGSYLPRQIGNSVPPLLARAIGAKILKLLGYHVVSDEFGYPTLSYLQAAQSVA